MDDQGVVPGRHQAACVDEAGHYHAHVEADEVKLEACGSMVILHSKVFFLRRALVSLVLLYIKNI